MTLHHWPVTSTGPPGRVQLPTSPWPTRTERASSMSTTSRMPPQSILLLTISAIFSPLRRQARALLLRAVGSTLLPARLPRTASQLVKAPTAGASWSFPTTAEQVSRMNRYLQATRSLRGGLSLTSPTALPSEEATSSRRRTVASPGPSRASPASTSTPWHANPTPHASPRGSMATVDSTSPIFYTANGGTTWTMTSPNPAGIGTSMTCSVFVMYRRGLRPAPNGRRRRDVVTCAITGMNNCSTRSTVCPHDDDLS